MKTTGSGRKANDGQIRTVSNKKLKICAHLKRTNQLTATDLSLQTQSIPIKDHRRMFDDFQVNFQHNFRKTSAKSLHSVSYFNQFGLKTSKI